MKGIKATYTKYTLAFKRPSGTSRGILTTKDSWFVFLNSPARSGRTAIGECSIIRGLSPDDRNDYEVRLQQCLDQLVREGEVDPGLFRGFPSIRFGLETAMLDLQAGKQKILFPSDFTEGKYSIPINGLVWMGNMDFMKAQIRDKLNEGFACLKMKIGALDFESELELLMEIRKEFSPAEVELRVDANGAFDPGDALEKLNRLSECAIHSIEQPIRQGQEEAMARLCEASPLPIALDEELIGIEDMDQRITLLESIKPRYIILKPSLTGGLEESRKWIGLAAERGIGWWITSALESNIGLNAIAQWTYTLRSSMFQGLGTGQLYTNNIPSPLVIRQGQLFHDPGRGWDTGPLY